MQWKRIGRAVSFEGTTVYYQAEGTDYTIESRKRHIPHASRSGTWEHTFYYVVKDGVDIKECARLSDAKEYAENYKEEN